MLKRVFLATALIAGFMSGAWAQSKSKNGGQTVESQGHPIEFVNKGQEIVFYVSDDDGSPLDTKQMRGRATVQADGKTTTVTLNPAAPNMMIGKLDTPLSPKTRVAFSASLHGHALTARYTVAP
jgi:protein-disulfide isomerase